uniref:RING-type domain-containing protein n=1 Tax=Erpetoichthys calabaricus TaxID=27687 RepID=A0A8C4T3Z1_ERPCA
MAEDQLFVSQDEFTCSVCLDTLTDRLTDPVTIPCGHSFCLKCLTDCWDQSQESSCPQCRENFTTRPCDFCTGKKFRAVKSCLTCMASYCQTHLQPHYEGDIYCNTDDSCICMMCVVTGHYGHENGQAGGIECRKRLCTSSDVTGAVFGMKVLVTPNRFERESLQRCPLVVRNGEASWSTKSL